MTRFLPIAIVGRACVLPGVASPDELWDAVVSGADLVTSVPADRWRIAPDDVLCDGPDNSADRTWSDRGGYVRGFNELFDPKGFALPADEILALDPVFQWTFHTAREALRDAGHADADPARFGAVFGNLSFPSAGMAAYSQAISIAAIPGYATALDDGDGFTPPNPELGTHDVPPATKRVPSSELGCFDTPDPRNRFTSGLPALLLERALGLGAGAMALDAACASSLYAIKLACDRLQDGAADLMLAGAVNSADDLCIHLGFAALQALSRTGRSRPFHRDADGLVPAEGCGFVALRRLDDAVRDGDTIHGIIRGVGLSNDGRGRGMLVPSRDGQSRAISQALDLAGLAPNDISLLECHATGTQVGDTTEIESSAAVYADCADLPIGSLKSNTGHLIATAGVAGLIKVIEAMRHGVRPPTLHVETPLDVIAGSPFRLLEEAETWDRERTSDGILRAGVSAFGFGGNNAHLIVEEPGAVALATKGVRATGRRAAAADEPSGEPEPEPDSKPEPGPIAIVGIGILAASAVGRQAFTEALSSGVPCLDEQGEGRMPEIVLRLTQQKFPPNDLKATLAQQLAMLQVADLALADSGDLPGASTGVYVGMGTDPEAARFGVRWRIATLAKEWGLSPQWVESARESIGPALDAAGVLGTMPNIVANRLNSQYNIAGPSFTVSAEERSGIEALGLASRALRANEIDAAMVGAVDMSCDLVHRAASTTALPADRQIPGDAAVMLVLKRLDDAERDRNTVFAVLSGGRFDDGHPLDPRPDLRLGLGAGVQSVTNLFGHSHAASGLVHVAAAALTLHHRLAPGDTPLLASNSGHGTGLATGTGPRTVSVDIDAMDGITRRSVLLAEASRHPAPSRVNPPRLHIFSGATPDAVLADLASGRESTTGPARLVIVADGDQQLADRAARARSHIEDGLPPGEGVHFRATPVGGEMAFVFTGAGAAYTGMGAQLLRALPELTNSIGCRFPLGDVAGWVFDADRELTPSDYLWGTSLLSQSHAQLTRHMLKLQPSAAIGYSSGESSSLYAFGIWSDMDAMRAEIAASGMMERELGGEFAAIARAWGVDSVQWAMWNVLAPLDEVQQAIADEDRVHLAIINTSTDVVIGGDAAACERVVDVMGRRRCRVAGYNLACHVPEVNFAFHEPWVDIHTRAVAPAPGMRFYSNGFGASYEVDTKTCAEAITRQAETTLDFPATIKAAYADGVRIFVEHGPGGACTNFVRNILSDHDILAVHLDRRDKSLDQVFEAVAALVAAGVEVDHRALTERLLEHGRASAAVDGPVLRFPCHPAPVMLPPRSETFATSQLMAPAPTLPSVFARDDGAYGAPKGNGAAVVPVPVLAAPLLAAPRQEAPVLTAPVLAGAGPATPPRVSDPTTDLAAAIEQQVVALAALHQGFVEQQAAVHEQFLRMRRDALELLAVDLRTVDLGTVEPSALAPVGQTVVAAAAASVVAEPAEPVTAAPVTTTAPANPEPVASEPAALITSKTMWDKKQLEIHSSGRISELFGPLFEPQDGYEFQCRMPEPPLLLADRVTGLVAEPGVLGKGTIWTETDVERGAWYLNGGYMPAGFMIESGQADLMLISYMGIDLLNKGSRVYRLLGCTLTYHGDLPSPGETLAYEIRVSGHARHGDIRLFFFDYDCTVGGQQRLTVRDGQAGFFNRQELDDALGILWTPEAGRADLSPDARLDPPAVEGTKTSFSKQDVIAFSEGRTLDCFGPGFEWAETHTRTPKIQAGRQLFIDEITEFDPTGGPWGRGFMRCETAIADDAWFFDGHFKNDPCMPGNFMVEACIEAMSFYLAALGFTTRLDGWRFQPLPEQPFELKCRGEINPHTDGVAYELHVEEIWSGPHPTIICDVVGFVDGEAAFHAHRIGVELTPGWPLTSMPEIYEDVIEPAPVANDGNGFAFDWKAMISCAWGRPSDAFGSMYEMFDGTRRSPRLPGDPYHFISRVTEIDGTLNECKAGMNVVCEYDIPDDAWYFDENGAETMPFAVLLEAALQPCGWVASAVGSATGLDDDLLFRNLDGTGTLLDELTRTSGTLTTHVKLKSVSRAGGMIIEGFDVECWLGDRIVYRMDTVFGFFPPEAFVNQVGLAVDERQRHQLEVAGGTMIDLTEQPAKFCSGTARLAQPMLLMLDRATHIVGAGDAALGVVRGEKDVDVSEWFFKAHFFQDPVQPGSLGIEALLQLLQFYMLDTNMADGVENAYFEPILLDKPMTWKYRGQVTPNNRMISSVMEITEVGTDELGPFVIGTGSLWCDGLRIYEVSNMGMRIVPGSAENEHAAEVPKGEVTNAMRSFWGPRRNTPATWLGDDLIDGLIDRYVHRVMVPNPKTLDRLQGRSAIFLANHQVQVESLIVSQLLPPLTGVPMTIVANAKHEHRWIGELIRSLEAHPDFRATEDVLAYFDQARPETMAEILADVKAKMAAGSHSFFVHTDGTRAQSCRERTTRCSSVLLDLALELHVPIVPVRFTGGLPVDPIEGKAEFPVGHGSQDYWIGEPIEASELREMGLRQRVDRVVSAINNLGVSVDADGPRPDDPEFAALAEQWRQQTGSNDVFAALWRGLEQAAHTGSDTQLLQDAAVAGHFRSDGTPHGEWLAQMARLFFGPNGPTVISAGTERSGVSDSGASDSGASGTELQKDSRSIITVNRASHPHLVDHAINDTPVVPVVYALEWFARAACAHAPDLHLAELSGLKVLKGLVAEEFDRGGDLDLVVSVHSEKVTANGADLRLELADQSTGRVHYRCAASLTVDAPLAATTATIPDTTAVAWTEPVYGSGPLFHGPAFHVIDTIQSVADSGLVASVSGVVERKWPAEPWVTDPALFDGALQLALLWTQHVRHGPSLPTGIGHIRTLRQPTDSSFTATLVSRKATKSKVVCDVVFRDEAGATVAELLGIETHLLPSK